MAFYPSEGTPKKGTIIIIGGTGKSAPIIFEVETTLWDPSSEDWEVIPLAGSSFYFQVHEETVDFTPTGHIDSVPKQPWWNAEEVDYPLSMVYTAYNNNTGV